MKRIQWITFLKICSIIVYLLIAKVGPKLTIPLVMILLHYMSYGISQDIIGTLVCLPAVIGIILILYSTKAKRKFTFTIIGYFLTYIYPIIFLMDEYVYRNLSRQLSFFLTTGTYFTISFIVIYLTYRMQQSKSL